MLEHKVKGHTVWVIDDLYSNAESLTLLEECSSLLTTGKLLDPHSSESARFADGTLKKSNRAAYIDDYYVDRAASAILTANRRLFSSALIEKLSEKDILFRAIGHSTQDRTLVSYYEKADYYEEHYDTATVTALTWLYAEPKRFTGGDLIIEGEQTIPCVHNRTVVMPSFFYHAVSELSMSNKDIGHGLGRFTISQFCILG